MSNTTEIEQLLAKQEIYECLMRYARGVDRHDRELILSTFHPDAVNDAGVPVSPQQLADAVCGSPEDRLYGHMIGNVLIELHGDTALVEAYFMAFQAYTEQDSPHLRLRGSRFVDRFEKRDGSWKVARRVLVDDWSRIDRLEHTLQGAQGFGTHPGSFFPNDPVYKLRDQLIAEQAQMS